MPERTDYKTIDVAGTKLRYLEAGSGPTLLFLHGAEGDTWSPLLDALGAQHRVIAPEHPGFGRTPIPAWMMNTGDLAYFYLDVVEALGLRDLHLVGHCIGGWVAAEMAIRNTQRLASLTLLAPAGVESRDASIDDIFAWGPEEFARRQFHDPKLAAAWQAEQAKLDIDIVLQNRTGLARLAWNPRLHSPQLPHWLHRIDIPTLLIWGENDRVIPVACHQPFIREIKRARFVSLPNTGHALPIEGARNIEPQLKAFFQGGAQG
jgi:pimeloyl-ACP methyl ester carboxylesterase